LGLNPNFKEAHGTLIGNMCRTYGAYTLPQIPQGLRLGLRFAAPPALSFRNAGFMPAWF
jgi:hypothetical protein